MTMASAARMQPLRLASRSRYQTHPLPITDPNFLYDDLSLPLRQLIEEPRTLRPLGFPTGSNQPGLKICTLRAPKGLANCQIIASIQRRR
jgi:hypothetical protein